MKEKETNVWILPISGGYFPNQIAIVKQFLNKKYKPDIMLATSGGNLTAYLTLISGFNASKIDFFAHQLRSQMFLKPWSMVYPLSMVMGYYNGSLYSSGIGVEEFMTDYLTKNNVFDCEIWTGTVNKKKNKPQLFCNLSEKDSKLSKYFCRQQNDETCLTPIHADGDIAKIIKYSKASAAIPGYVPPIIIDDEEYVDGGHYSPSPIQLLNNILINYVKDEDSKLHMIYIHSENDEKYKIKTTTILDDWLSFLNSNISNQCRGDCNCAKNILSTFDLNNIKFCQGNITKEDDRFYHEYDKIKANHMYTLLKLYPLVDTGLSINNFNGDDVRKIIDSTFDNVGYCLYYV